MRGKFAQRLLRLLQTLFSLDSCSDLILQISVGFLKRTLGSHALGEVASDFAEAVQLAAAITKRSDDHICPESRTVFPDAPAFIFEPAFHRGDFEFIPGLAVSQVFFRIENREVLADNF